MPSARAHDGAMIDLRIHGSGPTILMHPLTVQSDSPPEAMKLRLTLEEALRERLSHRFRLVYFDYPGQPSKPDTLKPTQVVADLLAIADAADAPFFAWCGYSWTAVVGLQLAIQTNRLTGLVCGGWPPVSGPYKKMLDVLLEGPSDRTGLPSRPTDELQQVVTFYRSLAEFDDRAAQDKITCPRMCFAGTADDIYDLGIGATIVEHREELEQLGWDVCLLNDLDHMEVLRPEVFAPVVAGWFNIACSAWFQ